MGGERKLAREHGFMARELSDILCRWHTDAQFRPTSRLGQGLEHLAYVCEECEREMNQPRDEELVNFISANGTYAYRCEHCEAFVKGSPIAKSSQEKQTMYVCKVCLLPMLYVS